MSHWSTAGRAALFTALEAACDQIDVEIDNELRQRKSRDAGVLQELEKLRAQASRVADMESQNKALRDDLERIKKSQPQPFAAAISPENCEGDAPKNAAATAELHKLRGKYGQLKTLYEQSLSALRKRKDEIRSWIAYAESLETKVKKNEQAASRDLRTFNIRRRDTRPITREAADGLPLEYDLRRPVLDTSFISDPSTSFGLEKTAQPPRRAISQPADSESSNRAASLPNTSQTETQNPDDGDPEGLPILPDQEEAERAVIKEEPSSDPPVIVSERSVRKRKQYECLSPGIYQGRLKLEDENSTPDVASASAYFDPQESLDLDEAHNGLPTPRKRRLLEQQYKQRQRQGSEESGGLAQISPTVAGTPSRTPFAQETPGLPSVLRPISVNRRIAKPSSDKHRKARRRQDLRNGIRSVAEDTYSSDSAEKPAGPVTPMANFHRLDLLLNPTGARSETVSPRLPNRRPRDEQAPKGGLDIHARRALPVPSNTQPQTPQALSDASKYRTPLAPLPQPISVARSAPPLRKANGARESAGPIRQKPLSMMNLDDFKINPKYNDGHNFAFAEVVRNRTEREGLAGCTDLNCCGKYFRAMAKTERASKDGSYLIQKENIGLLENYLGDDACLLGSMSKEEKEELWLAAKTQDLANRYGKHRHRFHRRPSPPGFWNADFPSTQEEARDRQEGTKMEQALVQERYREAMRPDGRWIFRDE